MLDQIVYIISPMTTYSDKVIYLPDVMYFIPPYEKSNYYLQMPKISKNQDINKEYESIREDCLQDLVKIIGTSFSTVTDKDQVIDLSYWAFKSHWRDTSAYLLHSIHTNGDHHKMQNIHPVFKIVLELLHIPTFRDDHFTLNATTVKDSNKNSILIHEYDLSCVPGYILQAIWNIGVIYTLYCLYATQHNSDRYSPIPVTFDQMIELRLAIERITLLGSILSEDAIKLYRFLLDNHAFMIKEDSPTTSSTPLNPMISNIKEHYQTIIHNCETNSFSNANYVEHITFKSSDIFYREAELINHRLQRMAWVHRPDIIVRETSNHHDEHSKLLMKILDEAYRISMQIDNLPEPIIVSQPSLKLQTLREAEAKRSNHMLVEKQAKQEVKKIRLQKRYEKILGPIHVAAKDEMPPFAHDDIRIDYQGDESILVEDSGVHKADVSEGLSLLAMLEKQTQTVISDSSVNAIPQPSTSSITSALQYMESINAELAPVSEQPKPIKAPRKRAAASSDHEDNDANKSEKKARTTKPSDDKKSSKRKTKASARSALEDLEQQLLNTL